MKTDILNRPDLELFVIRFYDKVKNDPQIGFFFSEVVKVDWQKHIPVMVDFWENVLFFSGAYGGNPMEVHKSVNQKHAMTSEHFATWLKIFKETVDENFEGVNADNIKQRATNISSVMQSKILNKDHYLGA